MADHVSGTYFRPGDLDTGDMESQLQWHGEHRDMMNNMYRTSYQDMVHRKEVAVKKDMPSGYGGHIPSLRHDVLHRNTGFDTMRADLITDPGRETFASFWEMKAGIPSYTTNPRGPKNPPTAHTVPNLQVRPMWGLTISPHETLGLTTSQLNTARSRSTPSTARSRRGKDFTPRPSMIMSGACAMHSHLKHANVVDMESPKMRDWSPPS